MKRIHGIIAALTLCGAATVMGQNLITNPGFESSGSNWTLWKDGSASAAVATVTYPTTGAHSGTRYAHIDVTAPAVENWHIQFQTPAGWTASMGATYEMRFWAKSAASSNMHFSVQDGPANGFLYRTGFDFQFTPEWAEYTFTYISDDFNLTATPAGIRDGANSKGKALRVKQESGRLVVSLGENVSESWKVEMFDLRGTSVASASGKADGSVVLAHPGKSGAYFVRASTPNRAWMRKILIP
jgi:hypothetical protein